MKLENSRLLPKYVFRGTSLGYPGNYSSIMPPGCTHTTANPLKAVLFAMDCRAKHSAEPVIWIAETESLEHITLLPINHFGEVEEEINWEIAPSEFYEHCLGYINMEMMKTRLNTIGKSINYFSIIDNLSELLENTDKMSLEVIVKLVNLIKNELKKP